MDAKKLTLAVSFMMVLAAAFVLVVPSESSAADDLEITDAYFQEGTQNNYVKVNLSGAVKNGEMTLYFGETLVKNVLIPPNSNSVKTSVGKNLEEGTYTVVVESERGTVTKDIVWPTPVENEIKVNQAVGGTITASKAAAFPGETITVSYTEDDNYALVALYMNGLDITDELSFTMPNQKAVVSGEFKKVVVMHTVTFMVSTMEYDVQEVLEGATVVAPAEPIVIGANFAGWCTADEEPFDLSTPITEDVVLYASYTTDVPPVTEQTTKFVAAMSDDCNLVLTAYDGKIIGEGSATVTVYKAQTIRGIQQYIPAGSFEVTIDSDDAFCIADLADDVDKITAKAAGSYAVSAVVTLTNGTVQLSNYATFVEPNEQI